MNLRIAGRAAAAPRSQGTAAATAAQLAVKMPLIIRFAIALVLCYMIIAPTVYLGAPAVSVSTTATNIAPVQGGAISRGVWLLALLLSAFIVVPRWPATLKLLRNVNPYLLVFYALVIASIGWSIEPGATMRRIFSLLTVASVGLALAVGPWNPTHFQRAIRPILTAILVGSVIYVHLAPNLAIEQGTSTELVAAWRGMATQKNGLGSISALTLVLWWHAWLTRQTPRWLSLGAALLSAYVLLRSRSSSSLMAAVFSMTLMLLLLKSPNSLRRSLPYIVVAFASLLVVYSLAVLNLIPGSHFLLSPLTAITGKDMTFSGRTAIWAIIDRHIAYRPLLGSGYGAYWVPEPNSPSVEMLRRLYFYPTEAHNGYLDIINDLGVVGALILLAYLATFLRQCLKLLAGAREQGALYLTLLFMYLLANLSESRWLNVLEYSYTVMTLATMMLARHLLELQTAKRVVARAPEPTQPQQAPLQVRPLAGWGSVRGK